MVALQEYLGFSKYMDPLLNPYTPNAGAPPPLLVGRDDQLSTFDLLLARLSNGRTEQSMIITGLRGVGKTVLLGEFRKRALAANWGVVEIEVSKHDDLLFRRRMASELRRALLAISPKDRWRDRAVNAAGVLRSFSLSVDPEGTITAGFGVREIEGQADSGDLSADLTDLIVAIGEAAQEVNRGVVLLLDEVQFLAKSQLEALVMALHKSVQRQLPITMVGAGLPQVAELTGEAKSYSERLFKFPNIDNLDEEDGSLALRQPAFDEGVVFEQSAIDFAYEATGGYPYFIQEFGSALWSVASNNRVFESDVTAAIPIFEEKLDSSFFRVRIDRTTELERAYLRAMAELGPEPQLAGDVALLLQRTSSQCGPTRSTLVEKGLLYTPTHGFAAFTVPHFDRFMKRAVPNLDVPAVRVRRANTSGNGGA